MRAGFTSPLALACLLLCAPASADVDEDSSAVEESSAVEDAPSPAPRLRFGVSGSLGAAAASQWMGALGAEVRIGAQIDETWAVFYQASGLGAVSAFFVLAGTPATLFAHMSAVMVEATIEDILQLAIGPSFVGGVLDTGSEFGWWGSGRSAQTHAGIGPGLSHRVGVTFGGQGTGTRQGFSLAAQLDAGVLLVPVPGPYFYSIRLTLGWDTF